MAKSTLLALVQDLGRSISSDEIDELDETTESVDITNFLRLAFNEVLNRRTWEFTRSRLRTLDEREVGDVELNRLPIPIDIPAIDECKVRYRAPTTGRTEVFTDLIYLSPAEFIDHVQRANENDSNVATIINPDGVTMLINTDRPPSRFTSFDEEHIWFDAYEVSRGTGNLGSDTVIIGDIIPVMDWTDPTAVLPVPERMEQLIFNEAVQLCSVNLRQTGNPIAERNATRQYNAQKEQEPVVHADKKEINYGRRRR